MTFHRLRDAKTFRVSENPKGLVGNLYQPVIHFQHATINTAGAYICINGLYLFALGSILHKGRIPVYRIGGHRQAGESSWECAAREALEEASLHIQPVDPETTYLVIENMAGVELQPIEWPYRAPGEPDPILIRAVEQQGQTLLSLMYLAQAGELPRPSSEVKGLLLLDKENIYALCQQSLTLGQYIANGGQAILNAAFDQSLILEPFLQLRALSKLFPLLHSCSTSAEYPQ